MIDKQFLAIIRRNKKEVKTWPKWKQKIIISAENARTGNYYDKT